MPWQPNAQVTWDTLLEADPCWGLKLRTHVLDTYWGQNERLQMHPHTKKTRIEPHDLNGVAPGELLSPNTYWYPTRNGCRNKHTSRNTRLTPHNLYWGPTSSSLTFSQKDNTSLRPLLGSDQMTTAAHIRTGKVRYEPYWGQSTWGMKDSCACHVIASGCSKRWLLRASSNSGHVRLCGARARRRDHRVAVGPRQR